ncbi:MAG TPA: hypothetical protein VFW47_13625 [Phenylobacterium sp.]|nr:hypothetical protein [Phenylobacterium sp.]
MRRVLALAALSTLVIGASAQAETWVGYSAVSPNNVQWSYDSDYTYRDAQSKRVVVLTAVGKVGATPRMGPSAPGATDGVGSIWAFDCRNSNTVLVGSYSPSKPLAISDNWRSATPKKISSDDDKTLLSKVCAGADQLPVK